MKIFKKIYCRIYQTAFHMALPVLPYREPKMLDSVDGIPVQLGKLGKSVLLVTDSFLHESKMTERLEKLLE